ncbi:globin [Phaeobacter sp. HF9A]|uniref:globin n=1 Tax=Phaeobacter sp. HF9A TaxID=2721561 RepID=UPI0014320DF7|nr:globin [Phaeobacter sp. HF9A]NIZ13985.1 globin [Phaeobacter sp. HF9A]
MNTSVLEKEDADLVRASFGKVFARKAELTDKFYEILFQQRPEVKEMFKNDFVRQKEMFAKVLTSGVRSIGDDGNFAPMVDHLLLLHRHLNLVPEHVYIAQGALLAACDVILRPELSSAEFAAWERALRRLFKSMAAGVTPPAA